MPRILHGRKPLSELLAALVGGVASTPAYAVCEFSCSCCTSSTTAAADALCSFLLEEHSFLQQFCCSRDALEALNVGLASRNCAVVCSCLRVVGAVLLSVIRHYSAPRTSASFNCYRSGSSSSSSQWSLQPQPECSGLQTHRQPQELQLQGKGTEAPAQPQPPPLRCLDADWLGADDALLLQPQQAESAAVPISASTVGLAGLHHPSGDQLNAATAAAAAAAAATAAASPAVNSFFCHSSWCLTAVGWSADNAAAMAQHMVHALMVFAGDTHCAAAARTAALQELEHAMELLAHNLLTGKQQQSSESSSGSSGHCSYDEQQCGGSTVGFLVSRWDWLQRAVEVSMAALTDADAGVRRSASKALAAALVLQEAAAAATGSAVRCDSLAAATDHPPHHQGDRCQLAAPGPLHQQP